MDILGVGPLEVLLVIILALVVLGPQDMVVTARKIGTWIRKIVRSPMWREVMETSREIREIPTSLIRDSGIEEAISEVRETTAAVNSELSEATREVSGELQQANQELSEETISAAAEVEQAGETAVTGMTFSIMEGVAPQTADEQPAAAEESAPESQEFPPLSPEIPPAQAWVEESGNQPRPPLPADYPQTIALGVQEPPEAIPQPPQAADEGEPEQA